MTRGCVGSLGRAYAADEPAIQGPPITQRVGEIVDHPGGAVKDAKTAVEVTASAAGSASKATWQ